MIAQGLARRGISMDIAHESRRLGDVLRNYSDTSKARTMLGWSAQTGLEEGLEQTIQYFLQARSER